MLFEIQHRALHIFLARIKYYLVTPRKTARKSHFTDFETVTLAYKRARKIFALLVVHHS